MDSRQVDVCEARLLPSHVLGHNRARWCQAPCHEGSCSTAYFSNSSTTFRHALLASILNLTYHIQFVDHSLSTPGLCQKVPAFAAQCFTSYSQAHAQADRWFSPLACMLQSHNPEPLKCRQCYAAMPAERSCSRHYPRGHKAAEATERIEQPSQQHQRHSSRSGRLKEQTPSSQVSGGHVACIHSKPPHDAQPNADGSAVVAIDGDAADAPATSVDGEATATAEAPAAAREKQQAVGVGLCITDLRLH